LFVVGGLPTYRPPPLDGRKKKTTTLHFTGYECSFFFSRRFFCLRNTIVLAIANTPAGIEIFFPFFYLLL
jgi:hypothetical protein